ncbi:MAG: hypothetical protein JSV23_00750 [Promethearchaeota archaeon]|nr:MAG: hypothetical protein JSV23_00750 [Candidatus Lokiarchaeota archaeon]
MSSEDILIYISLGVSIAVLFFIIWDHIKDDRILAFEVQDFYSDIEMLIFTNLQVKYYEILQKKQLQMEEQELKVLIKNKNRDIIQQNYLTTKINQYFKLYGQYLGLTHNKEKDSYLNGTVYILKTDGTLLKRNIESNVEENIITSFIEITLKQISELSIYLNSLRFYWRKKYYKFLFRPQLKEKIVFDDLLGFVKPLEQKRKKYLIRNQKRKEITLF